MFCDVTIMTSSTKHIQPQKIELIITIIYFILIICALRHILLSWKRVFNCYIHWKNVYNTKESVVAYGI